MNRDDIHMMTERDLILTGWGLWLFTPERIARLVQVQAREIMKCLQLTELDKK